MMIDELDEMYEACLHALDESVDNRGRALTEEEEFAKYRPDLTLEEAKALKTAVNEEVDRKGWGDRFSWRIGRHNIKEIQETCRPMNPGHYQVKYQLLMHKHMQTLTRRFRISSWLLKQIINNRTHKWPSHLKPED